MTQKQHDKHKNKDVNEESTHADEENSHPIDSSKIEKSGMDNNEAMAEETKDETVTIPLKEYAAQMEEIDGLNSKIKEYSDGWQRERADFTNYRNRILRDQDAIKQNITTEVVRKYLAVNDDIELALKNAPQNGETKNWVEGIQLIYQKLQNILESEGVQRIPAENETFNPNHHEAIATEENPLFESGHVIEIIQQGYTIGDRVIRPARVKIAK
jgi:molecular chaperone GrpE